MIKCCECNEIFSNKRKYRIHLEEHLKDTPENKTWKIPVLEKEIESNKEFCDNCGVTFTNKWNLNRHLKMNTCKSIGEQLFELIDKVDINTKLKIMDHVYDGLDDEKKNTINYKNNVTINGDVNTVINLNIVNLGSEKLNFQEDELYQKIFDIVSGNEDLEKIPPSIVNQAILTLFEKIHCNKKHPENHNIYVNNKKMHKPFYVYKANKWESNGGKTTIHQVIIDTKKILIDLLDNLIEENTQDDIIETLKCIKETFEDVFSNWLDCEKYDENLTKLINSIHGKVYEHRDLLGRTFRRSGGSIRKN